jgi:hypothetical protein
VRGGFGLGGGFLYGGEFYGLLAAQARIGVQFNDTWGLIYSNTPSIAVLDTSVASFVLFQDWNTVMPTVTLADVVDLGVGPSLDVYTAALCGGGECITGTALGFGLHQRVAFLIGSSFPNQPRRVGFQLGADLHETFGAYGLESLSLAIQLGAEWF